MSSRHLCSFSPPPRLRWVRLVVSDQPPRRRGKANGRRAHASAPFFAGRRARNGRFRPLSRNVHPGIFSSLGCFGRGGGGTTFRLAFSPKGPLHSGYGSSEQSNPRPVSRFRPQEAGTAARTVWNGFHKSGLVDPQAGVALTRKPGPQYAFDM